MCLAQAFGTVRGTVTDPQQKPVPGAVVELKAAASAFAKRTLTANNGEFTLAAIPAGSYIIHVQHEGFQAIVEALNVAIGSAANLHFSLGLSSLTSTVQVSAPLEVTNPDASHRPVTLDEVDIQHTPGAERTSSLAFITDFVPGSYLLHDHLHMRGGRQVSWLVDGVPVPNTNISSNVGRALDPKDIETVEVSRGGFSSKYGDRTYGVINVIPRTGFEFSEREAELTATYGSLHQTSDQLSFGGHNARLAYYVSLTGNRTDLGLEPPTTQVIHNSGSGLAGFSTVDYNLTPRDQFRLAASLRKDHYQVPNTPEDQASGVRDIDFPAEAYPPLRPLVVYSQEQSGATMERKKSLIVAALSDMYDNGPMSQNDVCGRVCIRRVAKTTIPFTATASPHTWAFVTISLRWKTSTPEASSS